MEGGSRGRRGEGEDEWKEGEKEGKNVREK